MAIDSGRLHVDHVTVARDIALGSSMSGIATLLSGEAHEDYTEQSMFALLQAFGIGAQEVRRMAWAPLGDCPEPQAIFERVRRVAIDRRDSNPES